MARRLVPLYPLAFALYPACALYSANLGQHPPEALLAPLAVSLVLAVVALTLGRLSTRDWHLAALRAFGLLLLFFAAGRLRPEVPVYTLVPVVDRWVLARDVADGLIVVSALLLFRWQPRASEPISRALAAFSLVVLALGAGPAAWLVAVSSLTGDSSPRHTGGPIQPPTADLPHIYYVVLDGYGRQDVLRETYGFDNSAFLEDLEKRGFYVASRARANYCQTALSLASSLNMDYVEALDLRRPFSNIDRSPLTSAVLDNRVVAALRSRGYWTVAFSSGYGTVDLRNADRFLRTEAPEGQAFFDGFLQLTPVPPLRRWFQAAYLGISTGARSWGETHRARILATLDGAAAFAAESRPVFVLAHVLAPHPPFVFDRNGAWPAGTVTTGSLGDGDMWSNGEDRSPASYRRAYVDQLRFVNQRVLRLIDEILARSRRPVAILIQGDHGPGSGLKWEHPERTDLRERLAILSAYRLPGGPGQDLYPSISPVNSFRVVLRRALGLDLPRLPDRSFFTTWTRPYEPLPLREEGDGRLRLETPQP